MNVLNRLVLVRKGAIEFKGPQPLEHNGFWSGIVHSVKGNTLYIRLDCGTARQNKVIQLPIESDGWKIRYPSIK